MAIRLVLADDHPLILVALAHLFCPAEGFEVVAACTGGVEALKAARQHRPDVLILDLEMPGKGGLDVLRELAGDKLPMRTVLLATAIGEKEMLEAVGLGVGGVVLKEMPASSIVLCVRKVLAGEPWLEMRSASRALGKLMQRERGAREAAGVLTILVRIHPMRVAPVRVLPVRAYGAARRRPLARPCPLRPPGGSRRHGCPARGSSSRTCGSA